MPLGGGGHDRSSFCCGGTAGHHARLGSHSEKRTGLGPQHLSGPEPESSVHDPAAECAKANSSKDPIAVSIFPVRKSGQVLVRTYVLKDVEFPKVLEGMSGVLILGGTSGDEEAM